MYRTCVERKHGRRNVATRSAFQNLATESIGHRSQSASSSSYSQMMRSGVSFITETKRIGHLGCMKPFSEAEPGSLEGYDFKDLFYDFDFSQQNLRKMITILRSTLRFRLGGYHQLFVSDKKTTWPQSLSS